MDSDWEDGDDVDMMGRDSAVRDERIRNRGFQDGSVRVGDEGVTEAAEKVIADVAKASHALSFACGVEDALKDLMKHIPTEQQYTTPPDTTEPATARSCLFRFRKTIATLNNVQDIDETNLSLLASAHEASPEEPTVLDVPCKVGLLFVKPAVLSIQHNKAAFNAVE